MTHELSPAIGNGFSSFLRKLQASTPFDPFVAELIAETLSAETIKIKRGLPIETRQESVCLVLDTGFAGVLQCFRDGRRQVVRLLLPGDRIPVDHTDGIVEAFTDCTLYEVDSGKLRQMELEDARVAATIERDRAIGESRFIRWVAVLGGASAEARCAYFIAECYTRLNEVSLTHDFAFGLPVIQETIAQILGLSLVHTNKSLKRLKARGLVEMKASKVQILDYGRLLNLAGYNPAHCAKGAR